MVAMAKSNGNNFTDPREFARTVITAANLQNYTAAAVQATSAAAGFFTEAARRGVADDTNWTANTYKTILSVASGKGMIAGMGGPTGLAGTPTTTFEITVDGVLTEVAVLQTTTGQRSILGAHMQLVTFLSASTVALQGPNGSTAGVDLITTSNGLIPPWQSIRVFGTPCLIYQNSLLIRMKSTENNSTTTNQERQAFVQHMAMA